MMRLFPIVLIALFSAAAMLAAQASPESTIEVWSMAFRKPEVLADGWRWDDEGTQLELRVMVPRKHIVKVEYELGSVFDDKETNLMKAKEEVRDAKASERWSNATRGFKSQGGGEPVWGWHSASLTTDSGGFAVYLSAPRIPAPGSTLLRIKGKFTAICGLEKKTLESKDIKLDSQLHEKGGPFELTWGKVSGSVINDKSPTGIIVNWQGDKRISRLDISSTEGNKVAAEPTGSGSIGLQILGKEFTGHNLQYTVKDPPPRGTVRITYFDKLESVTIPVDLKIGLGF